MCMIDLKEAGEREFGYAGGRYSVDVLVGDSSLHDAIRWEVRCVLCVCTLHVMYVVDVEA